LAADVLKRAGKGSQERIVSSPPGKKSLDSYRVIGCRMNRFQYMKNRKGIVADIKLYTIL